MMSRRLHFVVADFLDALAAGRVVEIGEFGPAEQYTLDEQKQIGPQVGNLHRDGLIRPAGGTKSERKWAAGRFGQVWAAVRQADCTSRANSLRELAEKLDDDGGFIEGDKQLQLFEVTT